MLRAVVRGLAGAVVAGVLAAAAGCGGGSGGGSESPSPRTQTSAIEESGTPDASASVFLGQGADDSASQVNVPTARVGEPAGEDVTVVNPSGGGPVTVQNVAATAESGEMSVVDDGCSGVELQPGGTCRIRVRHVATAAGPFTGQLTARTSDGNVLTVGISGEATPGGEDTTGVETPSPSPTSDAYSEAPGPTDSYEASLTGGSRS
ncbi:hypothetical protein ACGFYU_30325 [Streptomyces sp. NPDC048337]|uniref:hypothetical protein n=1 Tax=Streptomyces sp. NPDC048337 TaxID=3365535 RepID=UPI003712AEAB